MNSNRKSKWMNLLEWYEDRGLKYPFLQKHKDKNKSHFEDVALHIVCENFFENMETLESLLSKMNLNPGCSFNIYENINVCFESISACTTSERFILWWMGSKSSLQKDFFKNRFGFSFDVFTEHDMTLAQGQSVHLLCSYHPEDWQKTQTYKKDVWLQALKIKSWL